MRGNLSIFISLQGCPYQCIYCDQRKISGEQTMSPAKAAAILEKEIPRWRAKKMQGEIAFFGGTFTGLPISQMREYLDVAFLYVRAGVVDGIRISTRPDCIDKTILNLLAEYGVTHIELGVQSLDDEVLRASGRGYTCDIVAQSAKMILDAGFTLGMQMMPGLPADTAEKSMDTARKIISLGARETRIYPTLVIRDTPLAKLYEDGKYSPLKTEEAVDLVATLKTLFEDNGVKVLKVGLHSGEIEKEIIAGPFHPAFGQLVKSKICCEKIRRFCLEKKLRDTVLYVRPKQYDSSDIIGQYRSNVQLFEEEFGISLKISKKELTNSEISIIL